MNYLGIKARVKNIVKAALVLSMCLIMPVTSLSAAAAEKPEFPDVDRTGSISVTFKDPKTGKPVGSGNKIAVYKVADVKIDDGFRFVYTADFESAGGSLLNDSDLSADLASKLEAIAVSKSVTPTAGSTEVDSNGQVVFSDLSVGLYLVAQTAKGKDDQNYTIAPFLVTIPMKGSDGAYVYDVDASPKVGVVTPPEKPPVPPHLPQTGQLWWPVAILAVLGVVFVGFGLVRKSRG